MPLLSKRARRVLGVGVGVAAAACSVRVYNFYYNTGENGRGGAARRFQRGRAKAQPILLVLATS